MTTTEEILRAEIASLTAECGRLRASVDEFWSLPADEIIQAVNLRKKPEGPPVACRRRLPDERAGRTSKFRVGPVEGYLTTGQYADGSLGEVFARLDKDPGALDEEGIRDLIACRNALLDALMTTVSVGLQVGVPLRTFVSKFRHTRFAPSGFTGDEDVPRASSILDYVFGKLAAWYESPAEDEIEPAPALPATDDSSVAG